MINRFLLPILLLANPLKQAFSQVFLINQTIRHPALDETVRGIKDILLPEGLKIEVHCAQGSPSQSYHISKKLKKTDFAIGVGTMAALSFKDFTGQKVFTSVTDPKGSNLSGPGVSNFVPLGPQLAMIKAVQPQIKRLGVLYNPGEINSVKMIQLLEQEKGDLIVVKAPVRTASDLLLSFKKIISAGAEGIFINNDNTVLSMSSAVVALATEKKIPVYSSDTDTVQSYGVLAALGPNQYELGRQTGRMILNLLKGGSPSIIAIEYPEKTELVLNQSKAKELGLVFPQAWKSAK